MCIDNVELQQADLQLPHTGSIPLFKAREETLVEVRPVFPKMLQVMASHVGHQLFYNLVSLYTVTKRTWSCLSESTDPPPRKSRMLMLGVQHSNP